MYVYIPVIPSPTWLGVNKIKINTYKFLLEFDNWRHKIFRQKRFNF